MVACREGSSDRNSRRLAPFDLYLKHAPRQREGGAVDRWAQTAGQTRYDTRGLLVQSVAFT